jgi:hypothetical protein
MTVGTYGCLTHPKKTTHDKRIKAEGFIELRSIFSKKKNPLKPKARGFIKPSVLRLFRAPL